jgi:hypothetical protein
MSASDLFQIEASNDDLTQEPVYQSKQWTYVSDTNNGNNPYTCRFQTDGLRSSTAWTAASEGYIAIPLVTAISCNGPALSSGNLGFMDHMVGFKSGIWNTVQSISVKIDDKLICEPVANSNVKYCLDAISRYSADDLNSRVGQDMFYPDSNTAWGYNPIGTATPAGEGFCANTLSSVMNQSYCQSEAVFAFSLPLTTTAVATATTLGCSPTNVEVGMVVVGSGTAANTIVTAVTPGTNITISPGLAAGITAPASLSFYNTNDLGANAQPGDAFNVGFQKRAAITSMRADSSAGSKYYLVKSQANFANDGTHYCASGGTAGTSSEYRVFYYTAKIQLKAITDIFKKYPITRGLNSQIMVNLNLGSVSFTKGAGTQSLGASASAISSSVTTNNSGTLPFMISRQGVDWMTSVPASTGSLAVGCYYGQVRSGHQGNQAALGIPAHPAFTVARLYLPQIVMNPQTALTYLGANKTKTIQYRDIIVQQLLNISSGASFDWQITPAQTNMKSVLVVPFLSASVLGINAFQSPWDSAPSTTSPLSIANFNVKVGTISVLGSAAQYGYEMFVNQVYGCNAVNGGQGIGVNSGLISESDWNNNYRYYRVDLSRRLPQDTMGKSLNVSGTNNTLLTTDYYAFVEVEKTVVIDIESGQVLESHV